MSRWSWMEPEHRAEVFRTLTKELKSSRLMRDGYELLQSDHAPEPKMIHAHELEVFHRLRAQWLEAAIEELGGEVLEDKPLTQAQADEVVEAESVGESDVL